MEWFSSFTSYIVFSYYPVAFAFTNNEKNCEAGWMPYLSHCYWISGENIGLAWKHFKILTENFPEILKSTSMNLLTVNETVAFKLAFKLALLIQILF